VSSGNSSASGATMSTSSGCCGSSVTSMYSISGDSDSTEMMQENNN
jgi:hypothetical protein